MVIYRLANELSRPFQKMEVTEEEFVLEYQLCFFNKDRKTDKLFEMMKPVFSHWASSLRKSDFSDINLATLLNMFESQPFSGYERIQSWTEFVEQEESLENRIAFLFFNRLRLIKHVLLFSHKPRHQEYVISYYLKRDLFVDIRKRYEYFFEMPTDYVETDIDFFALDKLGEADLRFIEVLMKEKTLRNTSRALLTSAKRCQTRIDNIWNQIFLKEERS